MRFAGVASIILAVLIGIVLAVNAAEAIFTGRGCVAEVMGAIGWCVLVALVDLGFADARRAVADAKARGSGGDSAR